MSAMLDPLPVWEMGIDPIDLAKVHALTLHDPDCGVSSEDQSRWAHADYALWERYGVLEGKRRPVVLHDPPLQLHLSVPGRFDLDYFTWNRIQFCSARLRAALAQPPEVIQYLPVTVNTPEPRILALDYRIMRVLPSQPVIDVKRSALKFKVTKDRFVGGHVLDSVTGPDRVAVLAGLQPLTEVFRADEHRLRMYAMDGLAARVMQAGCLGLLFEDPESCYGDPQVLVRTAKGAAFRSPATRRAHVRLVRRRRRVPVPSGV